jgi:hypothetical protein
MFTFLVFIPSATKGEVYSVEQWRSLVIQRFSIINAKFVSLSGIVDGNHLVHGQGPLERCNVIRRFQPWRQP